MSEDEPLPWLSPEAGPSSLPDPSSARLEPNGLLAAGGALTPDWLVGAYRRGIFPWFSRGQPILWWSPDPRAVFFPEGFVPSKSLRQSIRNRGYESRLNHDFAAVIAACAAPRADGGGTWITPAMRRAYETLHAAGIAHSFETWHGGRLVGGLYGVHLGGVFFGESMFAHARDASKVALAQLVGHARERKIALIDCQMPTPHLESLGAQVLSRPQFLALLTRLVGH